MLSIVVLIMLSDQPQQGSQKRELREAENEPDSPVSLVTYTVGICALAYVTLIYGYWVVCKKIPTRESQRMDTNEFKTESKGLEFVHISAFSVIR